VLKSRVHPVIPARDRWAPVEIWPPWRISPWHSSEGKPFSRVQGCLPARRSRKPFARWCSNQEGLALLNGNPGHGCRGGLALLRAVRVNRLFDLAGAMALEALRGTRWLR